MSAAAIDVVIDTAIKTTTESFATIRRAARNTKSARPFSMNPSPSEAADLSICT
jgi:hypothetical protein